MNHQFQKGGAMKRFIGLTMIAWMFLTVSMVKAQDKTGSPAGEEVKLKPQTTCPVLDGAISRDLFVDYQGKRIYVCCAGCLDALKADPEKYLKKLADEGIAPEDVPE